jgi:transporter family-2 protein
MELPRNFAYPLFVAVAMVAGFALPFQAGINGQLRGVLGSPVRAALGNFVVGAIVLFTCSLFVRAPWPALSDALRSPWWFWAGGVLGSVYIFSAIVVLPRLGASVTFALVVAGQMIASLAIDRLGIFGLTPSPVSPTRIAGAVLLVAAVYIIQR